MQMSSELQPQEAFFFHKYEILNSMHIRLDLHDLYNPQNITFSCYAYDVEL